MGLIETSKGLSSMDRMDGYRARIGYTSPFFSHRGFSL